MALGAVLPDRLTDVVGAQPANEQRRADERQQEGDAAGDEEGLHRFSSASRATARSSNGVTTPSRSWPVSWPLPAITTTSPGCAVDTAMAMAAARSGSSTRCDR